MELINEKVNHKSLGAGEIISVDGQYIEIQFASKISKFSDPAAFESFLTLEDADKQMAILAELADAKQTLEEKKRTEEARRKAEEARKAALDAAKPALGKQRKALTRCSPKTTTRRTWQDNRF